MVEIQIQEAKRIRGVTESAFVRFPYTADLVQAIKTLPRRYWHPVPKQWEVTVDCIPELLKIFKGQEISLCGANRIYCPTLITSQDKRYLPKLKLKTNLMSHQKEAAEILLNKNSIILADQAGLGKTLTLIAAALARREMDGYKHCLIINGVNILKWNWVNEIRKHTYEEPYILGQRVNKNGKVTIGGLEDRINDLIYLPDNYFLITNVESLRDNRFAKLLAGLCSNGMINMVALDESHTCCSPTAKQTKGWLALEAECRIPMTATPFLNKPLDLWSPLKWIGAEHHSYYQFQQHYTVKGGYQGREVVGYRFLEDLQELLDKNQIRRTVDEVLDLPEIIHSEEILEMEPDQQALYNQVRRGLQDNVDKILLNSNPLTSMIRLRQVTSNPNILTSAEISSSKLERLDRLLEERVQDRKVIVVSNWTQVINPLIGRYAKYNPAVITGDIKDTDRVIEQDKLNNDPKCRVMFGTIKSMGAGLTLTGANTMIYLDEPWNYAIKDEQCSKRIHRIGTTRGVEIITLICKDTIDERIHQLIMDKKDISDYVVDGDKSSREDLLHFLLN